MKIPKHIGFIMDGNGRWAKAKGQPRNYGHQKGADAIQGVMEGCYDLGVKVVSLYAFSTENWSRPKEEVDKLFDILRKFLKSHKDTFQKNNARLVVSGDITELPSELAEQIAEIVEETKNNNEHILNIAINYGSRRELVRAVKEIIKENVTEITEQTISDHLYTAGLPDVDLVVRTSGECRISNFLLYQSAYAEIYFTPTLWPDFGKEDVKKAIEWFDGRERRYGNV